MRSGSEASGQAMPLNLTCSARSVLAGLIENLIEDDAGGN
jgi:hypothetical protein